MKEGGFGTKVYGETGLQTVYGYGSGLRQSPSPYWYKPNLASTKR